MKTPCNSTIDNNKINTHPYLNIKINQEVKRPLMNGSSGDGLLNNQRTAYHHHQVEGK